MKRTIIISLALLLALTACQERSLQLEVPAREMKIAVLAPGVHTQVSSESFEADDRIGLFVTDYIEEATPMPLQISGNRATHIPAPFDGTACNTGKTV